MPEQKDAWKSSQPANLEVRTNLSAVDQIQKLARELGTPASAIGKLAIDALLVRQAELIKVGPNRVDFSNSAQFAGMLETKPVPKGPEGAKRAEADIIVFKPDESDILRVSTYFEGRPAERVAAAKDNDYLWISGHLLADRVRQPYETNAKFRYSLQVETCEILDEKVDITLQEQLKRALLIAETNAPTEVKVAASSDHPARV